MNQPARLRLPRLRLARSEAHLVVRVLRERRQGGDLGSDRQARRRRNSSPRTPSANSGTGSDYELENEGRLTHPMVYDARQRPLSCRSRGTTRSRGSARRCARCPIPNMAEFYTSGRASNEAAFLYQLFVREYGTNNFPDCSNMCHEATSVGLPQSIGVGKGTVTLEDFDHCDAIFCIGHNPGTNHPRMMTTLREASSAACRSSSFNPLRERGAGALRIAAEPGRDGDAAARRRSRRPITRSRSAATSPCSRA